MESTYGTLLAKYYSLLNPNQGLGILFYTFPFTSHTFSKILCRMKSKNESFLSNNKAKVVAIVGMENTIAQTAIVLGQTAKLLRTKCKKQDESINM